ncbi:hypothetical protein EJ641_05240, partial [Pseudomonas aeruginosa]
MGLFNAAANLFGQVYERATQVAAPPPPGGGGGGPAIFGGTRAPPGARGGPTRIKGAYPGCPGG